MRVYHHFVIVTPYGFVYEAFEDYSDDADMYTNLEFTDDVSRAYRFSGLNDDKPKYANSDTHSWRDLTLEKWIAELKGEFVHLKITYIDNLIHTVDNKNYVYEDKKVYELGYSVLLREPFKPHPHYFDD